MPPSARLILVRTILGSGDSQLFVTRLERGKRSIRSRIGDGSTRPSLTLEDDDCQSGDSAVSLIYRSSIVRDVIRDNLSPPPDTDALICAEFGSGSILPRTGCAV